MDIKRILRDFAGKCGKQLNLKGIIQFGSSTYSASPKDIDLVFFSNNKIFLTKNYLKLFGIIQEFEARFKDVSFNIAGGKREKKSRYSISIIPLQMLDLNWKIDPFFLKNISEDKNKIILYGKDPTNFKIMLDKKELAKRLSLEINHHLRDCLEKNTS